MYQLLFFFFYFLVFRGPLPVDKKRPPTPFTVVVVRGCTLAFVHYLAIFFAIAVRVYLTKAEQVVGCAERTFVRQPLQANEQESTSGGIPH